MSIIANRETKMPACVLAWTLTTYSPGPISLIIESERSGK